MKNEVEYKNSFFKEYLHISSSTLRGMLKSELERKQNSKRDLKSFFQIRKSFIKNPILKVALAGLVVSGALFAPVAPALRVSAEEVKPYDIESLEGTKDYKDKKNNIDFNDLDSHWSKDSIFHMAGLDVYRGSGNKKFGPEEKLTRDEALAGLIKAMGRQDEAIALQKPGETYWGQGYVDLAKQLGIVTAEETQTIEQIPDNIADQIDERVAENMINYEKDLDYTDAELTDIENNMKNDYTRDYTWEKSVDREQVAAWVARAKEIEPKPWSEIEKIYNLKDWENIDRNHLPFVEQILDQGIFTADAKGYFKPDDTMTKAELATVLKRIDGEWLEKRGYTEGYAQIQSIGSQISYEGPEKITEKIYNIDTLDDKSYKRLKSKKSPSGKYDTGFIVYKDGKLGFEDRLETSDYIKYYLKNGKVEFVEVETRPSTHIRGIIKSIDDKIYTIENLDTKAVEAFQLDPRANLFVNDLKAFPNDFIPGLEVKAEIKGGKIVMLNGVANKGEAGKIEKKTRYIKGKVIFTDPKKRTLTLDSDELNGTEVTLDAYTPIIKDEKAIPLDQVKPGDFVRLELDEYDNDKPSKVYVGYEDKQVENFIKGTLGPFTLKGDKVVVEDPLYYDGVTWSGSDEQKQYPLSSEVKTYFKGYEIPPEKMSDYQGKEVYIVTEKHFGDEVANHVFIKEGYERTYDDKIQDIAYGAQRLKIAYTDVLYNEGTVILKDGRRIDPYNLEKGDSIKVYTDEKGSAAFITVHNPPTSEGYRLVKDKIDKQTKYSFDFVNYDEIENQKWKDINDTRDTFQLSDETRVYDLRKDTDDAKRAISVDDFTKYRNEVITSDKSFVDKQAYAVLKGDMAIAVSITDPDAASQIITIAEIESKDDKTKTFSLKNAKDWSEFTGTWMDNNTGLMVNGATMLVVKGDRAVDFDKVQTGDQVYLMRWNDYGFVMLIP